MNKSKLKKIRISRGFEFFSLGIWLLDFQKLWTFSFLQHLLACKFQLWTCHLAYVRTMISMQHFHPKRVTVASQVWNSQSRLRMSKTQWQRRRIICLQNARRCCLHRETMLNMCTVYTHTYTVPVLYGVLRIRNMHLHYHSILPNSLFGSNSEKQYWWKLLTLKRCQCSTPRV